MAALSRAGGLLNGRRGVIAAGAVGALVVVLGAGALMMGGSGADRTAVGATPVFAVAKGPLTISVTEAGTITAKDQVIVKNEVEGRTTIIYLIDEGVRVKPGELLVELDSSALQTQLVDQEIKVQNAHAAMIQMREELAVAENQARADIAQAKLNYDFAQDDLKKYIEGEYKQQLMQANTEIQLKTEAYNQAMQTLEWSRKLQAEKYITQTELEKDETAASRAELELALANEALRLLKDYTYPRQIKTFESNVEQMQMALERTDRSAKAAVVKAEANAAAKEAEYNREVDKRDRLKDQIAKCKLTAPVEGMVVYSTTGKASWRGNEQPLAEGVEIRERQELIYLPTASAMQAEVKVHESSLDKIAIGMPVRVSIDAVPGKSFSGKVSKISPLPDGQSIWMNPDLKVYATNIELDGSLADVRTGMTCRAEILVDHYPEAMYVPVQSVVRVGGKPTVYVRQNGEFVPRPVEVGLSNNRMVRLVSGVDAGETVSLTPPLSSGALAEEGAMAKGEDGAQIGAMITAAKATAADTAKVAAANATAQAAAAPAGPAAAGASEGRGGDLAARMQNATPEQRAQMQAMRERMENATPEEREKLREQLRQQREAAGGASANPGAGS